MIADDKKTETRRAKGTHVCASCSTLWTYEDIKEHPGAFFVADVAEFERRLAGPVTKIKCDCGAVLGFRLPQLG